MAKINYKGLLLTFCSTNQSTPIFLCDPTGPPHDRRFICKVSIDDTLLGEAEGKQKKEAENKAAKKALESLGYEGAGFQPDFISLLSQFCQNKGWTFNFVKADRIGPPHVPEFACSAEVNKKIFPQSSRKKNKKLAEKEAAYLALKEMKKDFPDEIQELPEFFKDESKSENWSCSGSTSDASLDASTGENGLARLTTSDSSLDRSTAECGLQQSTTASEHQQNYTARVNEFCQKKKLIYNFVYTPLGGPPHMPQFSCRVEIKGKKYPESKPHTSKKLAQKDAAFLALMELKKEFPKDLPEIPSGFITESQSARSSILRKSAESGQDRLSRADSEMSSQSTSSSFSSGSNTYQNPLKDFKDVAILASGAFGRVFKAKKILDDMDYAVKEIPVRSKRRRYEDEVKALARLEHPNIVRYFNAWWADSPVSIPDSSENSSSSSDMNQAEIYLFIQMELCVKGSLKQWIKERNSAKPVDKRVSMQFFKQLIEAIKYIHSQKLIHRDLKPANIFCKKDMIIKIGDFGLVTQMTGEDESKARQRTQGTGTPTYMAPEQRDGNVYENEVDIYALGLIFFELLWIFGSGHERANQWMKIRKGDLPMEFSKSYPIEVYEIKRMLSENPKKRPSAEELHNIFETKEILDSRTQ